MHRMTAGYVIVVLFLASSLNSNADESPIDIALDPGSNTTIAEALQRICSYREHHGSNTAAKLTLAAGTYHIDHSLLLAGRCLSNLEISGPANARALISGGVPIGGLIRRLLGARLSPNAQGWTANIWEQKLSADMMHGELAMGDPTDKRPDQRAELCENGKRLRLARYPNDSYLKLTAQRGPDNSLWLSGAGDILERIDRNALVGGYFRHRWLYELRRISEIDLQRHLFRLDGGIEFERGNVYPGYFLNSAAALDSPGEWYYDDSKETLLVASAEDSPMPDIVLTQVTNALILRDISDVIIKDISFADYRGTAILGENVKNVWLKNIEVHCTGKSGIYLNGSNSGILGSTIVSTGDAGITLIGGDRQTLTPGQMKVAYSRVIEYGQWTRTYKPGIALNGVGNVALGNEVAYGPHIGILFSGNDHLISSNYLHDVAYEAEDVGVIYTGRDWSSRGTVVANNLICMGGSTGLDHVGIYLDDQASGITVVRNLIYGGDIAVLVGGGDDNVISNNDIIGAAEAIRHDERGVTWQRSMAEDPDGELQHKLRMVPFDRAPYSSRYPELRQILREGPGRSMRNVFYGNFSLPSESQGFSPSDTHRLAERHPVLLKSLFGEDTTSLPNCP